MWRTDSRIEQRMPAITLPEALKYEANRGPEFSLETFDHYAGFERVFREACEYGAREAFGHRFIGFENYGRPVPFLKGYDDRTVRALCTLYINYSGILDFLRDSGTFCEVFATFAKTTKGHIQQHYPDASVGFSHRGARKHCAAFNVEVKLFSRFP